MTGSDDVLRPTPEDARRWVAADFGVHPVTIEEVTGGTDTSAVVWRLVDDAGTAWAVKWTTRATRTGTRLVASMAAAGLSSTPATRPTDDGRRRSRRAGGRLGLTLWSPGEDAATVGLDLEGWRAYGALLADVHSHAFPLPARKQGARRGIRRRRRRYRAEIRALDAVAAAAESEVVSLWRDARPRVDLLLRGTRLVPSTPGDPVPCHGDAHLGNVLVEGDGTLRLVDWDEAVVGPRELDLHLVVFPVLFEPTTSDQLDAFGRGYGPVEVDEQRMVKYACIRALEDLTSTMRAAVSADGDGPERDETLRVFTGILGPTGSATLVEGRLRDALDATGTALSSSTSSWPPSSPR